MLDELGFSAREKARKYRLCGHSRPRGNARLKPLDSGLRRNDGNGVVPACPRGGMLDELGFSAREKARKYRLCGHSRPRGNARLKPLDSGLRRNDGNGVMTACPRGGMLDELGFRAREKARKYRVCGHSRPRGNARLKALDSGLRRNDGNGVVPTGPPGGW